jgi:membrane fusion protein (multidrug efflux system)
MVIQVIAAKARRQAVAEKISLVGTLAANEQVEIKSEIDGTIEAINFEEGQTVRKGDLLLKLDQTKLAATVAQADANFKLAQANLKRSEALLQSRSISQQEYEQATATFETSRATVDLVRRQLKDASILAPFDGMIGARLVSPGQVITRGMPLSSLINLDPIKAEFKVPERFLSQLHSGLDIEIEVAAYPGIKFKGSVYFIDPRVDESTRTALIKARLPNSENKLRPGMFGNLNLVINLRANSIVIPESAVLLQGDQASLFVVDKDNVVQPRMVTLGLRLAGQVEILKGLNEGETVVSEGTQKLRPGAKVSFAPVKP